MTVTIDKLQAIPITAGHPVNKVVVAEISAAGTEGATALNALLGFNTVVAFFDVDPSAGMPFTLTSGALSLDPSAGPSTVRIVVFGR